MDEAASQVRMAAESASPDLKDLEEKIAALHREKEEAVTAQDFEKAAQLRDIEKDYQEQVEIERDKWHKQMSVSRGTRHRGRHRQGSGRLDRHPRHPPDGGRKPAAAAAGEGPA